MKFLILLVTCFFSLVTFVHPVYAQEATLSSLPSSEYTNQLVVNLIHTISCFGAGASIIGKPCTINGVEIKQGAIGMLAGAITYMSLHPPASGIEYLATSLKDLQLIQTANAQVGGTGQLVVEPVVKLWQGARNIAYLALIIVLVVIGLMIIFRQRINPQTVVSAQQALPGVAVALILITFSYFLAGLIIDLAFLLSHLFGIAIISSLQPTGTNTAAIIRNVLENKNVFNLFTDFTISGDLFGAAGEIGHAVGGVFAGPAPQLLLGLLSGLAGALSCAAIAPPWGAVICGGLGAIGGLTGPNALIPLLVYVVLLIALLSAMFRLFFSLIGAYVAIILNTIFGPFLILGSAIPGRGGLFGFWIRGLLGNVLIFPIVFGLFALVAALLNYGDPWMLNGAVGTFTQTLPLFGNLPENFIRYILAYGLLLAAPGVPDYIRQLIAGPTPGPILQAIQGSIGGGTQGATAVVGRGAAVGRVVGRLIRI